MVEHILSMCESLGFILSTIHTQISIIYDIYVTYTYAYMMDIYVTYTYVYMMYTCVYIYDMYVFQSTDTFKVTI
jgi:hypothetical protein